MIMYKTTRSPKIEKIEVEKTTESSVWINGRRRSRKSSYECYFDTKEDAISHYRTKWTRKLQQARILFDDANKKLKELDNIIN